MSKIKESYVHCNQCDKYGDTADDMCPNCGSFDIDVLSYIWDDKPLMTSGVQNAADDN